MADIQQKWEFMRDNIFKTDTIASPDFDSLIHGTNTFILNAIKDLANYIGTRNIFIEMQRPIFDELYLPTVEQNPFRPFLSEYFDPWLESTCESVSDAVCVDLVIKATFRNLVYALQMVILDGGDRRIFQPTDSASILRDITSIENFFYADGEGIRSRDYVTRCTAPLKAIVGNVMDKQSQELILGGRHNVPFANLPVRNSIPWCKQIVYRVLYHRADDDAKKFLKNNVYKY